MNAPLATNERDSLLAYLRHQREAVHHAVYGLREDQARVTPTASTLSLGGLVKHLAYGERNWSDRIEGVPGPDADEAYGVYMGSFVLAEDETLASVLADYERESLRTDAVISAGADMGRDVPLPDAPWYPATSGCSVRWVLLHMIEETARHAGHADVIREALDGAQSGPLMAADEGWPADGWIQPWTPAGTGAPV